MIYRRVYAFQYSSASIIVVADLSASVMIGDKLIDIQAGAAAGCRTILVRSGYGTEQESFATQEEEIFDDLLSAVKKLVG